jgi:LysR family transcriptional regulator, hydrogen peroxide-inducible genes activator
VDQKAIADELLVLGEGHCLASQALDACGGKSSRNALQSSMQAANLETLVNLVAAGYGATLIPRLALDSLGRLGIAVRPLTSETARSIRLASRPGFPRPQALRALEKVIKAAVDPQLSASGALVLV